MVENEIIINGEKFNSFLEFIDYMNDIAFNNFNWHGNLDALNDLLRGGFNNKIEGKNIHWINSDISKDKLGYSETIKWLEERIIKCHPTSKIHFMDRLENARKNIGSTLFDMIIETIMVHGPDGKESGDIEKIIIE